MVKNKQVWDAHIIHASAKVTAFPHDELSTYFSFLVSRIKSDDFDVPTSGWLACSDPATAADCALSWAHESNAWTCEYVYVNVFGGVDLVESGYAEGAYPIVELQVSKAALRLGTWLNRLVAAELGEGSLMQVQHELKV